MTTYCSGEADCVYYKIQLKPCKVMVSIGYIVRQSGHETVFQVFPPEEYYLISGPTLSFLMVSSDLL